MSAIVFSEPGHLPRYFQNQNYVITVKVFEKAQHHIATLLFSQRNGKVHKQHLGTSAHKQHLGTVAHFLIRVQRPLMCSVSELWLPMLRLLWWRKPIWCGNVEMIFLSSHNSSASFQIRKWSYLFSERYISDLWIWKVQSTDFVCRTRQCFKETCYCNVSCYELVYTQI